MKIMTSYFYQIRFFDQNMIPFSTAVFDPKWYHNSQGHKHLYFDKRGIVNGLRAPMLVPPTWCQGACRGYDLCTVKDPTSCAFLKAYGDHINTLDINEVSQWLERACLKIRERSGFAREPIAVLIFHEKYDNPCSERVPVVKWLQANGAYAGEFRQ